MRVPCVPQYQWSSDVIEHVTIVGGSNNGPLMSYNPSLVWALSATTLVPHAPHSKWFSDVIETITIVGGSNNGWLMSDYSLLLWALAATACVPHTRRYSDTTVAIGQQRWADCPLL
jgi:hypothetical protein